MKKKYLVPSMTVEWMELEQMCVASVRVDGDVALTYDEVPQDASEGLSRGYNDLWIDDFE
jgi:hypothetical protein